jgi:hypothetical protein
MPRILVDASLQRDVEELHRLWGQKLPKVPGQIGGAVTTWVVGQRIGNDIELFFNDGFLPTLRASGIAFNEG